MSIRPLQIAVFLGTVTTPFTPSLAASTPPKELFNKSVILNWHTSVRFRYPEGPSHSAVLENAVSMYFSSTGRMFRRVSNSVHTPRGEYARGASLAPGGNVIKSGKMYFHTARFEGSKLYLSMQAESGGRQIAVDFDSTFSSCALKVLYGREDNAPGIVIRGPSGRLTMLESATAGGYSCAVKTGNVFGGDD